MTRVAVREALIGLVHGDFVAAFPNVPIVYDNDPFDRNNPPPVWVEFEINYAGGDQIGMSARPVTRQYGFVYVTVWVKEGTGSKDVGSMCDWFSEKLAYRSPPGVCLQAAEDVDSVPPTGWYTEQVKLYFYTNPP